MDERKWWKECVAYQIYPQSFCDSNGDGVGDIPGITGKLGYLAELGADILWISPFYPSPGYDNGYDISDYTAVDPRYGTMSDFEELIEKAHALGLKIVIDIVANHTSSEHAWFKEANNGPDSPKRDYYVWRAPKENGDLPNNWGAVFGGPAWTKGNAGGEYYLGLFSPQQPDLNWNNPDLREDIYAMMNWWLEKGVDGFRLDVISLIAKPDDYSDGPAGQNGYFDPRARIAANPELHVRLREMRQRVFANRDIMTVGEASAITLEAARQLTNPNGSELDMAFQFENMDLDGGETFKWNDRAIPLPQLKRVMAKWQQGLEGKGWNALFWNNHDQPRMLSRLGDEGMWREASATMLATCLHMMKGTPFIYQGEELGMTNMRFASYSQLRDSESRNAYRRYTEDGSVSEEDMLRYVSLKSRDTARTPMQWNASPGAGFSMAEPWMALNPNYIHINAREQQGRKDSVLAYYRKLIQLRHSYEVIVYGKFAPYQLEHPQVFAYIRTLGGQTLLVCCNFTPQRIAFAPPKEFAGPGIRPLLGNTKNSVYLQNHHLSPWEAIILLKEEEK